MRTISGLLLPLIFLSGKLCAQRNGTITPCSPDSLRSWMQQTHLPGLAIGILTNGENGGPHQVIILKHSGIDLAPALAKYMKEFK
jgi:hypothetical protein